jgi:hypothetical protein
MKIKRHTNINATNFEYLSVGTVFRYLDDAEDNSLYMRIKDVKIEDGYNNIINAIDLENGDAMCFSDCNTVVVVDGEFVINE